MPHSSNPPQPTTLKPESQRPGDHNSAHVPLFGAHPLQNEAQFSESILESMPGIVYFYDSTGRFLRWNRNFQIVSGYSAEEIMRMHPLDFFSGFDKQLVEKRIMEVFSRGESFIEAMFMAKDGSTNPYYFTGRHVTYDGKSCLLGVGIDISERTRAEQQRIESEQKYRELVELANSIILRWNSDGRITLLNEFGQRFFGYNADEIIGKHVVGTIVPETETSGRDLVQLMEHICADPRSFEQNINENIRRNGERVWIAWTNRIVYDANGNVAEILSIGTDITERRQMEETLRLQDRAIQQVSQGIVITDPNLASDPIVYVSHGFERITGYTQEEAIGKNYTLLFGEKTDPAAVAKLQAAMAAGRGCEVEFLNYRKDGAAIWIEFSVNPVFDDDGSLAYFVGVQTDSTARKQLEDQLRQSQKMDAIGKLAGGVAHDFNNLLTIISGYSNLILETSTLSDSDRDAISEIKTASERAASLTRQLLAFSRQTILQPVVLDLNVEIAETSKMLQRLIGEDVELRLTLDPAIPHVKFDPGHLNQVLVNLAVNARDAMPKGGLLTIQTARANLTDEYAAAHIDSSAGSHVMLAMSDTGCGMTPEVQASIFEPFFTTKGPGKGTGLGLSTVFGIVQQSGGFLHVYSEVNCGTTFKIYLPAVAQEAIDLDSGETAVNLNGTETVLVVEDEAGVRGLASRALIARGYRVMVARDGLDALRITSTLVGPLHLVVTDVVMPNLGGPAMAEQLRSRFPAVKILFTSGYTDDAVIRHGLLNANVPFLQKPYSPLALATRVRCLLDE
ncbi:MAG: PAS domain S-box protein [Candidatus Hydrogenedentes bacterium]|nr:PAS domain S-box protein [Candidatus Hydrogenedentota bacterium]